MHMGRVPVRVHAFTELTKHKGCGICVMYSELLPPELFKIHIKSYTKFSTAVDLVLKVLSTTSILYVQNLVRTKLNDMRSST